MRFNVCSVKHINALLRCSLVVTAVALLRSLLRSALLCSSLNEPLDRKGRINDSIFNILFHWKEVTSGNLSPQTCLFINSLLSTCLYFLRMTFLLLYIYSKSRTFFRMFSLSSVNKSYFCILKCNCLLQFFLVNETAHSQWMCKKTAVVYMTKKL